MDGDQIRPTCQITTQGSTSLAVVCMRGRATCHVQHIVSESRLHSRMATVYWIGHSRRNMTNVATSRNINGIRLKTTNRLESLNSLVAQRVAKVDRWRTSDQKQRWLAAALLDIEPRLRRIKGFRALPLLRVTLERDLQQQEGSVLAVQVA